MRSSHSYGCRETLIFKTAFAINVLRYFCNESSIEFFACLGKLTVASFWLSFDFCQYIEFNLHVLAIYELLL